MRWRSDTLKANLCRAQQCDLKTIALLLHRPIVLTDTIDYRTIGFFCTIVLTLKNIVHLLYTQPIFLRRRFGLCLRLHQKKLVWFLFRFLP